MFLILTQCFPSRVGGIENLISNLALSIAKENKVIVLADQQNFFQDIVYDKKNQNKLIIKRYGGIKFFRKRKKIKDLNSFIDSTEIKCVIADTWKSLELCIDRLNKKKITTICLVHGNELILKKNKKIEIVENILSKTNFIVANSKFTENLLKKNINIDKKINVIYPGAVDLRSIESDKFLKINGWPVLLTLSRLEKRKGHVFILNSINELKKNYPNIRYIIAGDGLEKNKLKKLVKNYNLSENVIFTGNVNDSQKKFLFECSTLMIMPTIDDSENRSIEGFGISFIEAASYGVGSIGGKDGGASDAISHNKTGLICDGNDLNSIYDSVIKFFKNDDFIKFGKNAKEFSEQFHWDKVVKNYLKLIN